MSRAAGLALAVLCAAAPSLPARALEPRFDHRDTQGVIADLRLVRNSVAVPDGTVAGWQPALRVGYAVDVTGEGDELVVAVDGALRSWSDPDRERVLLAGEARYRGYFGTEELKTFFEVGAWLPVRSRVGVGPLLGLGLVYDFSRWSGVFAGATFASAFGSARVTSFGFAAGAQARFPLP